MRLKIVSCLALALALLVSFGGMGAEDVDDAENAAGGVVEVVLRPDDETLHAKVILPEPVDAFRFDNQLLLPGSGNRRVDRWRVVTPGLSLDGDIVRRSGLRALVGRAFDTFEVSIEKEAPGASGVFRVGEGWFAFTDEFAPAEKALAVRLTADAPDDWIVRAHDPVPAQGYTMGYLFMGPPELAAPASREVFLAPGTPAWTVSVVETTLDAGEHFFGDRLGQTLAEPVRLVITQGPGDVGGRGRVGPGGQVALRLFGEAWTEETGYTTAALPILTLHELFHHYSIFYLAEADSRWSGWSAEGAAEYVALVTAADLGFAERSWLVSQLNRRAPECYGALEGRSLAHARLVDDRRYDCGVLFYWALDLGVRAASDGERDVLDVLRTAFADAGDDGSVGPEDLFTAAGEEASAPARVFFETEDDDVWPRFAEALNRAGAEVALVGDETADRQALMRHVISQDCGPTSIIDARSEGVRLTGQDCDALGRGVRADAIAGFDIFEETAEMYDRVVEICAAHGAIDLSLRGEPIAQVACLEPPPPKARVLQIHRDGIWERAPRGAEESAP